MDKPTFLNIDPEAIKAELKQDFENMTGRILYPGQVEQLLINAFAYREYLIRSQIQESATMNLVEFSRAPFLDHLGMLVGVRRLIDSKASAVFQMDFETPHEVLSMPKGMRIQSDDGLAVFALDEDTLIEEDAVTLNASFTCLSPGAVGNGYQPGEIIAILDPQPYLYQAFNIETSVGGADKETDDELRERIKLAPQSFSNAGSKGAYNYFARSANPAIIDVSVTSPVPGQVNIYPLLKNGEIPNQAVLDEVDAMCNSDKIRPLTDTVFVIAPTPINYNIEVELTLVTGSSPDGIISLVKNNLTAYAESRKNQIGLDIVQDKIISECMKVQGVYSVTIVHPTTTVIGEDSVAICGSIDVSVTGYKDE